MNLHDALLALASPHLDEGAVILYAKVAADELGDARIATDDGVWAPRLIESDEEFLAFGLALRRVAQAAIAEND